MSKSVRIKKKNNFDTKKGYFMKKIFPYIFGILSIFCFGIIAGCNESPKYNLSFEKSYIEMSIGDTLHLSTVVKIDNANKSDIKFTTHDASVVALSGQTITAVNSGVTIIDANYDTAFSYMEVILKGAYLLLFFELPLTFLLLLLVE